MTQRFSSSEHVAAVKRLLVGSGLFLSANSPLSRLPADVVIELVAVMKCTRPRLRMRKS